MTVFMRRLCTALALAATLSACDDGDDSDPIGGDPQPDVTPQPDAEPAPQPDAEPEAPNPVDCVEDDFGSSGWLGPASVDGALSIEADGTYQVSTTVLYLKPTEEAFVGFNQKLGPILGDLDGTEGLLAYHFGGSPTCGSQRTISVWRDAESMYRFVGTPAHVDAMLNADAFSAAFITDAWAASGADISNEWPMYIERLSALAE